MFNFQICSESIKKAHCNKLSSKQNQKKKSVTENQSRSNGGVAGNTKLQKAKVDRVVSVPKLGSKEPSAALLTKKSKGKTENNEFVNKEDNNEDETKKLSRKKNKKSVDVPQKQNLALLARKTEDSEQQSENSARKAGTKKGALDQKGASLSHSDPKEEKERLLDEEIISKTGSEISKSKKRRIRKRRLLESLGVNIINSVKSTKDKSTTKKRKKNSKSKYAAENHTITDESLHKNCTSVKSVNKEVPGPITSRSKETSCGIVGKKGAIRKPEDIVNFTKVLKDTVLRKPPELVTNVKETQSEKKVFADTLPEVKEENPALDSSTTVEVCSTCEDELPFSDSKIHLEDISLQFLSKTEVTAPSRKTDIVNILSHDNVEGLFRSALLNDVTLSSRCSEKEVKNFFNTYGTFSERGRTQFAAVEKLLHSNSKGSEDIATSQYFEPALDEGISPSLAPQNSTTTVNKEASPASSTSTLSFVKSPQRDCLSSKHVKDYVDAVEPVTVSCVGNLETASSSYNEVVKGVNHIDSVGNNLVFKGGLCRGPIYTSPNLENRVTSSANSNQILNSASRVFMPHVYLPCDLNQQDKFGSCEVANVQRLDSELVDSLSRKQHFLPGDTTQLTEVCSVSEQNTYSVSPRLEEAHKEQVPDYAKATEVNTVECQVDFACKNDMVFECRATQGNFIAESHPSVNAECPKEGKPVCTGVNKNICTAREKEDSGKLPEKIQENSGAEKYRWIGFVSECDEDIQETGFEANKTVESVISLKEVEESRRPDHSSDIGHAEVNYPNNRCNAGIESVFHDIRTESSNKEQGSLPNCSSVTEAFDTEIVKSSPFSSQDKVSMSPPQRKPVESSHITRPEKSRAEILAAREAKKANKLARNKNKVMPTSNVASSENVPVTKEHLTSSSKSRQQQKLGTVSGKGQTEYTAESESVSQNTVHCPDVKKEPHSPGKDINDQKSEVESKLSLKQTELKKKNVHCPEIETSVSTGSMNEDGTSGKSEILREKVKEISHGAESLTVSLPPKSVAELRAERRAKQVSVKHINDLNL
jgi:hypothetical protein